MSQRNVIQHIPHTPGHYEVEYRRTDPLVWVPVTQTVTHTDESYSGYTFSNEPVQYVGAASAFLAAEEYAHRHKVDTRIVYVSDDE